MAGIQKRGKTYQYNISRTVDGKQMQYRKGGFLTRKEALIAATELEDSLNKGIVIANQENLFDEYFDEWLKVFKSAIGKNTRSRYENTLETIRKHFAGVRIQGVTRRTYQAFLNEYGASRSKDTVRKLNTHIRACVRDAMDEGIIKTDFTRGATFSGKVPAKRPEEKHLNFAEAQSLIKLILSRLAAKSHYLILLGLSSGMRFAELVGLTRSDFDFNSNQIAVTKTWGYTNKMHEGFGPTKNPQSVRTLPIDAATMAVFKEWFDSEPVEPGNVHELVFFSSQSKYHVIGNNAANKTLEGLLKTLGIEPISAHGLRHTHASILLYKDVSIYYVSERLGHGDIETTMSYYAHIVKELREKDELNTLNIFKGLAENEPEKNNAQIMHKGPSNP